MHHVIRALLVLLMFSGVCVAQVNWVTPVRLAVQDVPSSIYAIESNDQGHFVIGVASVGTIRKSLVVTSLDPSGGRRWTYAPDQLARNGEPTPRPAATQLVIDSDGAPVVAFPYLNPAYQAVHCVAKLAYADGHELWRTCVELPGGPYYDDLGVKLAASPTGGYFLQSESGLIVKLAANGDVVWSRVDAPGYGARGVATSTGDWVYLNGTGVHRLAGTDGRTKWSYAYESADLVRDAALLPRVADATDATVLHVLISNSPLTGLTDRLLKLNANGQVVWTQDTQASEYFVQHRVKRMQAGSNVLRIYRTPDLIVMVSATNDSGAVTWQSAMQSDELYALGGQLFQRNLTAYARYSQIDAATGALLPEVQFPLSTFSFSPFVSSRFVLFSNTDTFPLTAARLEAFAVDATPLWSGDVFRTAPLSNASSSGFEFSGCLKPLLSVAPNGELTLFTRFSVVPKPSEPQQPDYYTIADYRLKYSSGGVLIAAQKLGEVACPPAQYADGSSLVFLPNFGVRKILADSTVAWSTQLYSSSSYGRTFLLADGTAIAQQSASTARLSETGAVLAQATLLLPGGGIAELADAVPRGSAELLAVDYYARAFRTDGTTLRWSVALPPSGCEWSSARTVQLLPHLAQSVLIVFNDCDGAKVARLSETGSVLWQRPLVADSVDPSTKATGAFTDASGQLIVAGCTYNASSGRQARTLVQAFNADGSTKWAFARDLVPNGDECPTAVTALSDGRVFVAITSDRPAHRSHLLQLTAAGLFDGLSTQFVEGPANVVNGMVTTPSDRLAVLGTTPYVPGSTAAFFSQSLREIQPSSFARAWRILFASATQVQYRYGDLMTLTVRLVDQTSNPYTASQPVSIRVYADQGGGHWVGDNECLVPAGGVSCDVQGRWSKVEGAFSLRAESDGVANAFSSTYSLLPATPKLTVRPVKPLTTAWEVAEFDLIFEAPAPVETITGLGFNVALGGGYQGSCSGSYVFHVPPFTHRCTMRLPAGTRSYVASVSTYLPQYEAAYLQVEFGPINLAQPTVILEAETTAPTRNGDRARFFVRLMAGGVDVTSAYNGVGLSVGCPGPQCTFASQDYFDGLLRFYFDVYATSVGTTTVQGQFAGNLDLLPATSALKSFDVVAGAGLRGRFNVSSVYNPRFCATAPGASCALGATGEFSCDVPIGWTGNIYPLTDSTPTFSITFRDAPIRLVSATQVRSNIILTPYYRDTYFGGCALDVDGDGTVAPYTDGIIVLRAILGLTGASLNANATHACAPVTGPALTTRVMTQLRPTAIRPSDPLAMDIDGDGQITAATDGVLLLRALLGFNGDALINGAIGAGATRKTAGEIRNYVAGCGAGSAW